MSEKGIPFGRYELLERIGRGGMAEIYRARLLGPGGFEKILAIKRLLSFWSRNAEFTTMLVDEAKMLTHLLHPNIVHVFELGIENQELYIAMEYVHGKNLKECLKLCNEAKSLLPLPITLYIVREILKGLQYAHSRKTRQGEALSLVHRDISPQNILVSTEGDIKITDFGIAKAMGRSTENTQTGVLKGKFAYMSTEQARGDDIDHRSDLFTVGLILFECLTGDRFFQGKNDLSVLEDIRRYRPETIVDRLPADAVPLASVLMRALAVDPRDRYESALAFLAEIDRLLDVYRPGADRASAWVNPSTYFAHLLQSESPAVSDTEQELTRTQEGNGKTLILEESVVVETGSNPPYPPFLKGETKIPPLLKGGMKIPPLEKGARGIFINRLFKDSYRPLTIVLLILAVLGLTGYVLFTRLLPLQQQAKEQDNLTVSPPVAMPPAVVESPPQAEVPAQPETPPPVVIATSDSSDAPAVQAAPPAASPQESTVSAEPPVRRGKLKISATPWGLVTVPGFAGKLETPFARDLPAGKYPLAVSYAGKTLRATAEVKPGAATWCKANFASGKEGLFCR